MLFKVLVWIDLVIFFVILLWIGLFLFLTSYPKNWFYFKTFTVTVVQNPLVLKELFLNKLGHNPNPLPVSIIEDQDQEYIFHEAEMEDIWSFNKSYVVAKVLGVNLEEKMFSVVIILPQNQVFSDVRKNIKIECPSSETRVALRENRVVTDQRIDLFSEVAINDLVLGYCLDDKCDIFTKACALIKMSDE